MHHDRIQAHLFQQNDVGGEELAEMLLAHGVAAIFHHDRLAGVAFQIGQGGRECRGLAMRVDRGGLVVAHGRRNLACVAGRRQFGECGAQFGDADAVTRAGEINRRIGRRVPCQVGRGRGGDPG